MTSVRGGNPFVISCHLDLPAFKTKEWEGKSKKVGGENGKWEVGEEMTWRGTSVA